MNILIYIIFGWLIGELFHITLWEWFKKKFKLNEKKVKSILVFIGIALLIAIIGSGFYRVQSYENIIVTSITGQKSVKDNVGIKYSLLSSRETINLQKQIMKFPSSYEDNGYEIITSDNKPILVNSFLEYKIVNVRKWGIENKNTETKLSIFLSSKVKKNIQNVDYDYVKYNLNEIENKINNELLEAESFYGIELINFNLQITDNIQVKQSKSEAESQKIQSASLRESYQSEASALKIKYNSIEDKDFIKYLELLKVIEGGNIETIIIPENLNPIVSIGGKT